MVKRLTAAALVETLQGLDRVTWRILGVRGWHRVPLLLSMLRLATPTSIDLSVHRLPGVGTVPSTELMALINRPLATLLKGRNERPRCKL